ncbi:hypothetical protein Vafri_19881 [Volvox africanus]|uniref:U-box domain-containing protein n=1 Tax=Volvox africanus TaxID=51714 RepID=A0A8J4BQD2_9CHLO|nr:hypothetical protein Vafri_19881 [Volvox africanus]
MNTSGTDRITVTLPSRYLCCLSKRVMTHPVVLSGEPATHYDRDSLTNYISRNGWKSPVSGNHFLPTDILSCPSLEAEIGVQFWQLYQPDGVRPPVVVDLTGSAPIWTATVAAAPACPQPNRTHSTSCKQVSSVSGWRRVEWPVEDPGDAAGCSGRPGKVARLHQQEAPECDQGANLTAATQQMLTLAADGQQKSNQRVGAGEEVAGAKLPGSWKTAPMSWGTATSPSIAGMAVAATGGGTELAVNRVAPAANAVVAAAAAAAAAALGPVCAAVAPPAVVAPAAPVTMTRVGGLCTSRPVLMIDRVDDCPPRGEGDRGIDETDASAAPRPEQSGTAAIGRAATGFADSRRREVEQVENHDGAASRTVLRAAGSPEEGRTATSGQAAAALLPPAVTASAGAGGRSGSFSAPQQRCCSLRFPTGAGPVARAAMLRDWEAKQREEEEPVPRRMLSLAARVAEYHKLQTRLGRRAMLLRDELATSPWLLPQNPVPII